MAGPLTALAIYSAFFLGTRFLLGANHPLAEYGYDVFLLAVPGYILLKKGSARHLGLVCSQPRSSLLLGGLGGGAILAALPLLHALTGASVPAAVPPPLPLSPLFIPLTAGRIVLEQIFFGAYLTAALLKRFQPVLAVYATGIVFALLHPPLQLSAFLLGFTSAGLYYLTGDIIAAALFQGCSAAAWHVMLAHYPRLAQLLSFLF